MEPDRNVVPGGRSRGRGISVLIPPSRKDCVMTGTGTRLADPISRTCNA